MILNVNPELLIYCCDLASMPQNANPFKSFKVSFHVLCTGQTGYIYYLLCIRVFA